ncbi:MAG: imelysin family protein [Paracoccaceae bacterium]
MLRSLTLTLTLALATPALADFPETVNTHILPGYAAFAAATKALAEAADKSCDPAGLKAPFNAAFDAWVAIQHIQFGPIANGDSLAIEFWPDPKGQGAKAQRELLTGDPAALTPENFAEQSVAARGLSGLERLLYPTVPLTTDTCPLIRATATDLARMASEVQAAWLGGYAQTMLTAGDPGNTTFLTRPEVRQALFTQLIAGLEFQLDQRLARPLGTFDQPRPERAEARASGRSVTNIRVALRALKAMAESLTPDAPLTQTAFDRAITLADKLDDPTFAGVATPSGRLKVEILQQSITAVRDTALRELAPELDVGIGFNAADGD